MKVMNCREMIENIKVFRKLIERLRAEIDDDNVAEALELKKELLELKEDIESNEKGVALRDRIAKENGYQYVGEFTKFGSARAQKGKDVWCLVDIRGEKITDDLGYIRDFRHGFALCRTSPDSTSDDGFLTQNGVLIEATGDFPASEDGIMRIRNRKTGDYFINNLGERINDQHYLNSGKFYEGFTWVVTKDEYDRDTYSYIRSDGKEAGFGNFRGCETFYNGFTTVVDFAGNSKIIDREGRVVQDKPHVTMEYSWKDYKYVYYSNLEIGETVYNYIGPDGKLVFDEEFEQAGSMNEGLAWVKKEGEWYIANKDRVLKKVDLKQANFFEGDSISRFSDGVSITKIDRTFGAGVYRYAVVDKNGDVLFKITGDSFDDYKNGVAILNRTQYLSKFLVDKQGNLSEEYRQILRSEDFMIASKIVEKDKEKFYILDDKGKQVFGPVDAIDYVSAFQCEGVFEVTEGENQYLMDKNFTVIKKEIKNVAYSHEGVFYVEDKTGRYFWIDKKGNEIF